MIHPRLQVVGLALLGAMVSLLIGHCAHAARTINTLPWSESFDANNYGDMLWLTQQATQTWQPSAGYRGSGAAKFTRPLAEGYSGVGQLLLRQRPEQLNLRFLIWHGRSWADGGDGGKLVIMNREGNRGRPMLIYGDAGAMDTIGPCDGTVCMYRQGDTSNMRWWANGTERLKIGTGTGRRSHEWISVEFEANARTGIIKLYIDTQDGQMSGLYLERPMDDSGAGGAFAYVDIIGGYMNRGPTRNDAENYYMLDELALNTTRIGPPAGFRGGTVPPAIPATPVLISVE